MFHRNTQHLQTLWRINHAESVNLSIYRGEVLALLGDNRAGKSTFTKVLSGAYRASDGELWIEGKTVNFISPRPAAEHGIATVYHELALAENLSIAKNVFLGRELKRCVLGIPFLKYRAMRKQIDQLLKDLDAHIFDAEAAVSCLFDDQRQAVAICHAFNLNAQQVIMDEPTAALAVAETQKVL